MAARAELGELARGIHPAVLTERGLAEALRELAERAGATFAGKLPERRLSPETEAAAYFVCSEALANVAKHARAAQTSVRISTAKGLLTVEVLDDGVGGADAAAGSGLQGLADRIEALGGSLTVTIRGRERNSRRRRAAVRLTRQRTFVHGCAQKAPK